MATRVVSTKFAIEGESEYRASVSRINSEIKTLQSALKLTESQYQTNANSMAALTAKGEALTNLYKAQENKVKELRAALENAKAAESSYASKKQELIDKISANNKALEELKNTTGDTSEEQERLTAENKELADQLEKCEAGLSAAEKGVNSWQTQLNNAEIKLNDLDAELKENDKYMDEAKNSADGCATSIDEFGDKVKKSAEKANTLRDALMAAGVVAALKATADALEECVEASVDFESAMAGVAKTTDLTESELFEMGESIKALATKIPATAVEIANVTEAAGQLGIKKEDLLSFSEVMVNLGVATNLSSTEAASALAKFANVVGMSADDYERLGSTIVDLGNNFATTEADIVSMATRLASSGAIIGLSESEIMAVATALSSVGIEAEAGGSAISKLLKKFEVMVQTGSPALADFAAVAGMSADDFSKKWGENAVEALSLFIDGLGGVDAAGGSSVKVLNDLGITEVRMSNAVLSLASSNGILNTALEKANNAWDENSALAKEAATRYETTESKLQLLSNAYTNVKIAVGDQLTPALGRLADTGADVLNWAADMIEKHEWLAPAITAVATALGVLAASIVTYTAVTKLASAAAAAFTAILDTNPIFLAVTAVAALAAGIGVLVACLTDDAVPSVKELTTAAQDMEQVFNDSNAAYEETATKIDATALMADKYIKRLKELEEQGLNTNESQEEYRRIVDKLNSILPDLNLELDEQTGIVKGGTEALESQVDAWKKLALQEALTAKYQEQIDAWAAAELEVYENQVKLDQAITEGSVAQDRRNALIDEYCQLGEEMLKVYDDTTLSAQEQAMAIWDLEEQQFALDDQIRELNVDIKDNEKLQKNLTKAIEEGSAVVAENEQAVNDAEAALQTFMETEGSAAEQTDEFTSSTNTNSEAVIAITDRINELAEAYKDSYDAAYESISGQIGLFDEFTSSLSEDTDTVEKMMEIWNTQTQNLAAYTENLKLAAQYGLDEGLILSLSDGSAESAGYIATIIEKIQELGGSTDGLSTDAEEFVDKFNAAFARTEEAKESFAETVATIETDFNDAVDALEQAAAEVDFSGFTTAMEDAFANVGVDFNTIGKDAGAGMAKGIESTAGDVNGAAKNMAQGALDTTKATLQEKSPSKATEEMGENFDQGLIDGINAKKQAVNSTVKELADGITRQMKESATAAVRDYVQEFSKLPNETSNQISQLKSSISGAMSSMPSDMQSVGQQIVNGMITGMNNRSSALYSTVSSIVNSAIATAKAAAQTASPSKKTTKIFEDVGEGMVVGLENKRKRISETAQDVVDEALKLDVSGKIEAAIESIDDRMPEARRTPEEGGGNTTYSIENKFQIEKVEVRDDTDIQRIAQELYNLEQKEMRKRGVSK